MRARAYDLFQAYSENKIPPAGGCLVSAAEAETPVDATYAVDCLTAIAAVHRRARGLELEASGTRIEVPARPPADGSAPPPLHERSVPRPLAVDGPAGYGFAFFFPAGEESGPALAAFLEKTLVSESHWPPASARAQAARIEARLRQIGKGSP